MPFIKKAMPFVKKIAVGMWETIPDDSAKLPKIAIKSLINCPALYGIYWLVCHHAPPYGMWLGYFFAALSFTSPPKNANSRPNKEEPQQPSRPIILPASMTSSANPPR